MAVPTPPIPISLVRSKGPAPGESEPPAFAEARLISLPRSGVGGCANREPAAKEIETTSCQFLRQREQLPLALIERAVDLGLLAQKVLDAGTHANAQVQLRVCALDVRA